MDKKCIYNDSKLCDNCGDCQCDLNIKKICNNCGKCLEMDGYDIRAIRIDEIMDTEERDMEVSESLDQINEEAQMTDINDGDSEIDIEKYTPETDEVDKEDIVIDFIDDIPELSEIIEDEEKLKSLSQEIFPGLIKLHIKE